MSSESRLQQARQLIDAIEYLTLATVSENGDPWNAPVFFAHDMYRIFYWGSRQAVQHSQNIRANGKGYLVIYDSRVPAGDGRAVYMRVRCQELDNLAEVKLAIELLHERFGKSYMVPEDMHTGPTHRLYKAIPEIVWVKNEDIDVREEITNL